MPDSLSYIVGVDLTEPLPSTLNGVLKVLVDSRKIDGGDRRNERRLNGFPALKGEMRRKTISWTGEPAVKRVRPG
jgi:hypothetical protein